MNHKWLRCTIATFVLVLLRSLGGVVPGIHANQGQEVTRLAEAMPGPASSLGSRIRLEFPPSERQTQEFSQATGRCPFPGRHPRKHKLARPHFRTSASACPSQSWAQNR